MKCVTLLSFAFLLFPPFMLGQKVIYDIRFDDKVIGKDTFAIKKDKLDLYRR